MAGEIQLNSTTMATESSGTITLSNVNSATNRTNLGLGSIATQAADSVSITGGTIGSSVVFPTGTIRNVQLVKTVISSAQSPPTGTTVADITGSSISYTPTAGCTSVYYQFTFQVAGSSSSGSILSHGLYIDSVLQDDTKSGTLVNFNAGAGSGNVLVTITANISAYSGAKTLSVKCNNHSASYVTTLHKSGYWLNAGNTDFYDPILLVYSIM